MTLLLYGILLRVEAWPWFLVAAGGLLFQVHEYVQVRRQLAGRRWTPAQKHARRMQLRSHADRVYNHCIFSLISGLWLFAVVTNHPRALPSPLGLTLFFGFPTAVGIATVRMVWSSILDRIDREALIHPPPGADSPATVTVDTATLTVIGWSAEAETLFGWSAQEALGHDVADLLIPSSWLDRHEAGVAHWRKTGDAPIMNRRLRVIAKTRDRGEMPVLMTVMQEALGEETVLVGYFRPRIALE